MAAALYPGTFDPITLGHLDVIVRSLPLFDRIEVAVGYNSNKKTLFSAEERAELIAQSVSQWPKVRVSIMEGLTVNTLKTLNCQVIIRGLRAISDFEYEMQMALMNRRLLPEAETLYLMPKEELTYLNSSIVRELAQMGGPYESLVPEPVANALKLKYANQRKL